MTAVIELLVGLACAAVGVAVLASGLDASSGSIGVVLVVAGATAVVNAVVTLL